jgi:hypothetical protein
MGTSRGLEGKRNRDTLLHEQQLRFEGSGQTVVALRAGIFANLRTSSRRGSPKHSR